MDTKLPRPSSFNTRIHLESIRNSSRMPMTTQFAISLEVAKLLPLQMAFTKSVETVMNLARSLQSSGSNIVVEEDLALLLGRSRLSPRLESSFKTVMKASSAVPPTLLAGGIVLQRGPGPTMARALSHAAYFATVVQLSLLAWTHESNALAQAIVTTLERRMESAPSDADPYDIAAQDDITKTIRSCEEQTSSFNWNGLLMPVATTLGIKAARAQNSINFAIFRGLVEMLPLVQQLNEDRFIQIETDSGICMLVVWAHHVLGMTVLVSTEKNAEVRFGPGVEQIFINVLEAHSSSAITLLDSSGEILFHVQSEADDFEIEGAGKFDLKGYGTKMLAEICQEDAVEAEVELIITAVAINVAQRLEKIKSIKQKLGEEKMEGRMVEIDDWSIILAANLLFDREPIRRSEVQVFEKCYSAGLRDDSPFAPALEALQAIRPTIPKPVMRGLWELILGSARCLISLLLALTQVTDLQACEDLPLRKCDNLRFERLTDLLRGWNGKSNLSVADDTWFDIIAALLVGNLRHSADLNVSLLSRRGWSIFFTSIGCSDPEMASPGKIKVVRAVPSRNDVRKHGILDGPQSGLTPIEDGWAVAEEPTSYSRLRCENRVEELSTLYAERQDFFISSLRLQKNQASGLRMRRSGYREYHTAIWAAELSKACSHPTNNVMELQLPLGVATVTGFPQEKALSSLGHRIIVYLTAFNSVARWLALLQLQYPEERVLLRSNSCCYQCVINQALIKAGRCYIIL